MRTKTVQSSFLSGVLDPRAKGRVETDAYNNGMLYGDNVIVHHLGGVQRRDGMRFLERLSNVLTLEEPSSATAPNGGTTANGYDDDDATLVTTTTGISTTDPYVVLRYDLGSAKTIRHADIKDVEFVSGSSDTSEEFVLQYSTNDVTYVSVAAFYVTTDPRSYRFVPLTGSSPISARYWRIARVGSTDLSTQTVQLSEFNLWTETSTISNARIIPFELSTTQQYMVVLTDRSAFIYESGALLPSAYLPMPYGTADLAELDAVVGADAMFLVHEDYPPRYIIRDLNGTLGHSDFQTDEVAFDSVPQYDFNDGSSPSPTSEVQVITFDANWKEGDTFQITLDGARTGLITFAGDTSAIQQTTTANNIARAVQKLYSVPGFTGVTCARTGALAYTVTFANESAKTYEGLMSVTVGTTSSTTVPAAAVTQSAAGVPRSEDIWSSTRGYPRTVTFFEGRLYFGGTRSKQQTLLGSAVNVVTEFEILEVLDDDPIFVTLNGQQLNAINGLFSGRSLQLFTSGGEFRYVKQQSEPVTPNDAPVAQTQYGSKKIRPVGVDGATIFVQRTGKSIRDFRFDYEEDAYNSLGLSSLAPHLITGASDLAAWQGSSTDEINLVFVVNGDGTAAILNLRREAEVRAWTRMFTGPNAVVNANTDAVSGHDAIKAVGVSIEDTYFAVQRTINGTDYLFLEVFDPEMRMDAAVKLLDTTQAGGTVTNEISTNGRIVISSTSVAHLVGAECRITIDGWVFDNITPDGSNVNVSIPSSFPYTDTSIVRVGLNFNPRVTPMPLNSMTPTGANIMDKRRVVGVKAKVYQTLGLLVNGRPLPDRYSDINNFDEDFDDVLNASPQNHDLEETTGWDEGVDKLVTFTQVDPLPMHILAVVVDMESS